MSSTELAYAADFLHRSNKSISPEHYFQGAPEGFLTECGPMGIVVRKKATVVALSPVEVMWVMGGRERFDRYVMLLVDKCLRRMTEPSAPRTRGRDRQVAEAFLGMRAWLDEITAAATAHEAKWAPAVQPAARQQPKQARPVEARPIEAGDGAGQPPSRRSA